MTIASRLVARLARRAKVDPAFPPELFRDYQYVFGPNRCCHSRTVALIHEVAATIRGVASVTGNTALFRGKPRWQPDAVLWDGQDQPLCVVEYESLNSSDARIVYKDFSGYEQWVKTCEWALPLVIITTLPKGESPWYRLLWTQDNLYNAGHKGQLQKARRDPYQYWYRFYRGLLKRKVQRLPVSFANFDGNDLQVVEF